MRLEHLFEEIGLQGDVGGIGAVVFKHIKEVEALLAETHPTEIAPHLESFDDKQLSTLIQALPVQLGTKVLEALPADRQEPVLQGLNAEVASRVLADMAPDERADLMQRLPEDVAARLLGQLQRTEPEAAEEVRELTSYGEDTAGGLMTTEYVALQPELKAWQAIEEVRKSSRDRSAETIYYIYVVAYGNKLIGVLSLKDLILADPGQSLAEIMTQNVVNVAPQSDQEEVARIIAQYDLSAVPVVDAHGHMLGVVTVDDVVDVVIEEATEDAQRMAAVEPIEDTYFNTDFWTFIQKRITWLLVLFFGELLTTVVMQGFEAELAAMVDLVVFIPLIISSGGNSGSQSSSLIIRALAIGEMRPQDWFRVVQREISIGLVLGVVLGVVGFIRAWWALWHRQAALSVACAVGASIVLIVTMGSTMGSLLPLLMKRLGLDPAVSSTPFIASLVDVLGLLTYFTLSRLIITAAF